MFMFRSKTSRLQLQYRELAKFFNFPISIQNLGRVTLSSQYRNPVHLAYHLLSEDHEVLIYDGFRTVLPHDLEPGKSIDLQMKIELPQKTGKYFIQMSLVQEHFAWFHQLNSDLVFMRPLEVYSLLS